MKRKKSKQNQNKKKLLKKTLKNYNLIFFPFKMWRHDMFFQNQCSSKILNISKNNYKKIWKCTKDIQQTLSKKLKSDFFSDLKYDVMTFFCKIIVPPRLLNIFKKKIWKCIKDIQQTLNTSARPTARPSQ